MRYLIMILMVNIMTLSHAGEPVQAIQMLGVHEQNQDFADILTELTDGVTQPTFDTAYFQSLKNAKGEYEDYWENGQLKFKATFQNSFPEGHFHGYYPNGKDAFKGYMENEKKLGVHIAFFPTEHPKAFPASGRILCYNAKGQLDDEQTVYWSRARLKALVTYKNGLIDGEVMAWDQDRQLIEDLKFQKGNLLKKNKP